MSTKIYYGCKIPSMTFIEAKVFSNELKCLIKEKCFELIKNKFNYEEYKKALPDLQARIRQSSRKHLVHPMDFRFELSFIPVSEKSSYLLAYPFTDRNEIRDVFLNHPLVQDYSYWNNTDRPEDISHADWEQRRKDWDDSLGYDTFAKQGFSIVLHENNLPLPNMVFKEKQ